MLRLLPHLLCKHTLSNNSCKNSIYIKQYIYRVPIAWVASAIYGIPSRRGATICSIIPGGRKTSTRTLPIQLLIERFKLFVNIKFLYTHSLVNLFREFFSRNLWLAFLLLCFRGSVIPGPSLTLDILLNRFDLINHMIPCESE